MKHSIMKRIAPLMAAALLLAACGERAPEDAAAAAMAEAEASLRETVTEADPQAALDEIYESLPDAQITALSAATLRTALPDIEELLEDYYGYVSNPNGGLADVFILDPTDGNRSAVRDALRLYQQERIRQFENYDILDAFPISSAAEVFDQGDYVVMFMLPDNEAAREIIDKYIPL